MYTNNYGHCPEPHDIGTVQYEQLIKFQINSCATTFAKIDFAKACSSRSRKKRKLADLCSKFRD